MSRTKASLGVIAATAGTVLTLFLLPFTPRLAVRTAVIARGDLVTSACLEGVVTYREQLPALSPEAGKVSAVCVREGQRVQAGQLLFALDASLEEQALAALTAGRYERERALDKYGQAAAAALAGETLEWKEKELALRQRIAAKGIRADRDGLVDAVYVREGDLVPAGALLGVVRGEALCVTAVCPAGSIPQTGAAALVTLGGGAPVPARLISVSAPEEADGGVQRLCLAPLGDTSGWAAGRRVTAEIVCAVERNVPLAPLEAFDSADRLWLASDGTAVPVTADTERRNGEYVRVPESLLGARVILSPEGSGVTPGRGLKEAKER